MRTIICNVVNFQKYNSIGTFGLLSIHSLNDNDKTLLILFLLILLMETILN